MRKTLKSLYVYCTNLTFIRFLIVGFLGLLINLVSFYISRNFGLDLTISATIAFFVAVSHNYVFNSLWSFFSVSQSQLNSKDYFFYVAVNLFSLLFNIFLLHILVDMFTIKYENTVQFVSVVVASLVTYFGIKTFIYTKKYSVGSLVNFKNSFAIPLIITCFLFVIFQSIIMGISPISGALVGVDSGPDRKVGLDFHSYYYSAKHLHGGDSLYFAEKQKLHFEKELKNFFVYPPLMAVLFTPFSYFQFELSFLLYTVFCIAIFIVTIILLSESLYEKRVFSAVVLFSFFSSPLLIMHLDRGQTDVIILFLLTLSYISLRNDRNITVGILIGFAASLKITPLIFLPYLFLKSKKAFLSSIATIAIVFLIFPLNYWQEFFEKIFAFSTSISSGIFSNGLLGVISNRYTAAFISPEVSRYIFFAIISIIIMVTFIVFFKSINNEKSKELIIVDFAILSSLMIIIPPTSWVYNGVLLSLLFAGYWTIRFSKFLGKRMIILFDLLGFVLVSQLTFSPIHPFIRSLDLHQLFALRPLIILAFIVLFLLYLSRRNMAMDGH